MAWASQLPAVERGCLLLRAGVGELRVEGVAMRTFRTAVLGGLTAAIAGCGSRIPEPQAIQKRLELQSFDSCAELETYVEDTAVLDMRTQLEQAKKGYSVSGGGVVLGKPEATMAASPSAAGDAASGPTAYTTTNTQVAGV